ncbi:MAG: hypothetical protein QXE32_00915 [Sulfolobales archaeon]
MSAEKEAGISRTETSSRRKKKYYRKLTKIQYILLREALSNPRFELVKEVMPALGLENTPYSSLVRIARDIAFRKDLLGLAFSPYRADLERYVVAFKLKGEFERSSAIDVARFLPYNYWIKSITISTMPMGDTRVYYLIPRGENMNTIVEKLRKSEIIDDKESIFVHKMDLSYYQVPDLAKYCPDHRKCPLSIEETFKIIDKEGLKEPDTSELEDLDPRPPPDVIDVVLMSLLEVRYIFSPRWLSRGGPLMIGVEKARYHFLKHIRNKYLLGAYLRRPLNPRAELMYTFIIRGGETLKLGYTLSRTPYANVLCDPLNVCVITFWIRSEDISKVDQLISRYNVRIVRQDQRVILPEEAEGKTLRSLRVGFPIHCYSIKGRRWYTLKESEKNVTKNIRRLKKKFKKAQWAVFLVPQYLS